MRVLLDRALNAAKSDGPDPDLIWGELAEYPKGLSGRLVAFVGDSWTDEGIVQQAVSQLENAVAASVARHSFCIRVSPMLGLMGTLIPLGPALSGLANGDMQVLAGNLVVAFTATVVGLLISAVTFAIGLIRRTWYARDVTELEFLCHRTVARERYHVA
jgi:biopolymer transport protein ExbB/TolQ